MQRDRSEEFCWTQGPMPGSSKLMSVSEHLPGCPLSLLSRNLQKSTSCLPSARYFSDCDKKFCMRRRRSRETFHIKAILKFFRNFCNPCWRVWMLSLYPQAAHSKRMFYSCNSRLMFHTQKAYNYRSFNKNIRSNSTVI